MVETTELFRTTVFWKIIFLDRFLCYYQIFIYPVVYHVFIIHAIISSLKRDGRWTMEFGTILEY